MIINSHLYTSFCLLILILSFTPGPNVLLMVKYGLEYRFKHAIMPMPGIALALLTYVVLVSLGLSKVLSHYPNLYQVIRIAGACYLIYMGVSGFYKKVKNRWAPCAALSEQLPHKGRLKLFTSGYLCALTNPKILAIYLAFLPQFIDHSLRAFPQFLCLGLTHVFIVMTSMTTYCALANKSQTLIKKYSNIQTSITNAILIGLGLFLLMEKE
jgi:homoserine/homoserine lactone efflux protein